jgi:hypothetical protein
MIAHLQVVPEPVWRASPGDCMDVFAAMRDQSRASSPIPFNLRKVYGKGAVSGKPRHA